MNGLCFIGGRFWRAGVLSWAPTLTSHDPNPPLSLESPSSPSYLGGVLKRRVGSGAWVRAELKRWNGGARVAAVLKVWSGTEWLRVDVEG